MPIQKSREPLDFDASLEGMITLKRKQDWVRRYARVELNKFCYKKAKGDKDWRINIDLRQCQLKFSNRGQIGEHFIQITTYQNGGEKILLEFKEPKKFDRWAACMKHNGLLPLNESSQESYFRLSELSPSPELQDANKDYRLSGANDSPKRETTTNTPSSATLNLRKAFSENDTTETMLKTPNSILPKEEGQNIKGQKIAEVGKTLEGLLKEDSEELKIA